MANPKNRLIRNLTRVVCGVRGINNQAGYKDHYKRISSLLESTSERYQRGSNAFGATLWLLGIDKSDNPHKIAPQLMEDFLYENCEEVREREASIVAFRSLIPVHDNSLSSLEHTGLYVPKNEMVLHQPYIGMRYIAQKLSDILKTDDLKNPEFYAPKKLTFKI